MKHTSIAGTLRIWCEPYTSPVVAAERGRGIVSINLLTGQYSTELAADYAKAINKAIRFAQEGRDDKSE